MQIYGKEVDFKISRLKDAGNMELALRHMAETEKQVKKGAKLSETLNLMIQMLRTFFQEATGQDVLEGCEDLEEAKQACYGFLREVKNQKETVITFSADDIK